MHDDTHTHMSVFLFHFFAFVVLGLVSSGLRQEIGCEESVGNDLLVCRVCSDGVGAFFRDSDICQNMSRDETSEVN